jgi:phosphoribosylformylglycinamidine synthase
MKFGVCVFPGSNCDYDTYYVLRDVVGAEVRFLDFRETKIQNIDCVILPGGFSFGDYLRAGALASKTPIAKAIVDFAQKGWLCGGDMQWLSNSHRASPPAGCPA